jgi:putative ABC transport system permease protein
MSDQGGSRSTRFYRMLLRLLPGDFRGTFGEEMEQVFQDQVRDAERRGRPGLLRLWGETLSGFVTTAPREHLALFRQDAGFALRVMRKSPGFTLASILTLALGIGANTAIFSVVNAVLLKPLPYRNGERIVILNEDDPEVGLTSASFSVPEMQDLRNGNRSLDGLVEYHGMSFILLTGAEPQRVDTGVVSWNFFDLFGVRPLLGRGFTREDETEGAPAVLLLSYECWQRAFGGDPTVVGRHFRMNDKVHTVIGVLPPFPQYPNANDVYMPSVACPFRSNPALIANRGGRMVRLFGLLKGGVGPREAEADLSLVTGAMRREAPDFYPKGGQVVARAKPLRDELTHEARPTMWLLLVAAAFVLVIACASVANQNLARIARRERELSIRAAMGAGRARLFRQLLTESLLLSLAGGALGLLMASGMMSMLVAFASRFTPRAGEIRIDTTVLLFTLGVSLVTCALSGSAPALAERRDLNGSLKESGGGGATSAAPRRRTRSALIVAQFAASFVLLIGAGLMLRSLANLQGVDPGFQPERALTMNIYLNFAKYTDGPKQEQFFESLLEKVQAEPQVRSAAMSLTVPLDKAVQSNGSFRIEGRAADPQEKAMLADFRVVSPDYFRTLGIPVVSGRPFARGDGPNGAPVVILNQAIVRHRWPGEDPVGCRVSFDDGKTWASVVGVVGDTRESGLDRPAGDGIYLALAQNPLLQGTLIARTSADPMDVARAVVQRLYEIDPDQPAGRIRSLEAVRADSIAAPRLMARLMGLFAAIALLIAATGIGGVIALTVSQRTHEFGVRLAIGARPLDVLRLVLGQGLRLAGAGVALGLAGSLALSRVLQGLLFGVTPTDPLTFATVAAVLVGAAVAACLVPAQRAAGVDPLRALRAE